MFRVLNMRSLSVLLREHQQYAACLFYRQASSVAGMNASVSSDDLPRITLPHKMQSNIQKLRERQRKIPHQKQRFKSPLVIGCKRSDFNHHRGQTYSDFGPEMLASYGWKHRRSAGDYFTILCHDKNPALLSRAHGHSFADLGLDSSIVAVVNKLGWTTPTTIQRSAVPAILGGESTLCAAETGSGKTLAYLLPALQMLLQRRQVVRSEGLENSPSVIILTPARELADQIMTLVESLQQHLDFTAYSVCGGRGTKGRLAWPIRQQMDILVSTPGVLRKLLAAGHLQSSGLQQIVLDEADTLLDDSFLDSIDRIMHQLKVPTLTSVGENSGGFQGGVQFLLVGATMPRALETSIGAYIPVQSLQKVTTAGLHRIMPHVPQKFMRVLPSKKTETLLTLLQSETRKAADRDGAMMVFCNKSSTTFYLSHVLTDNNLHHALINGEMLEKSRHSVFEKFCEGHYNILLATDIASRGLDTVNVRHVVNYDFPNFISDYIHRAGRVGRVGSQHGGIVTSLVTHKWDVELLWQIETAVRNSSDLHNVNANIKRKLMGDYSKRHGIPVEDL